MADYVIVAENVRAPLGAPILTSLVPQNIGPGNLVWQPNANYVDLANAANVNAARAVGFTVGQAFTGQPIAWIGTGTATVGNAAIPIAHELVLSPNAGKFCNHADLTTNHYLTRFGAGNNANTVQIGILATGLQRA